MVFIYCNGSKPSGELKSFVEESDQILSWFKTKCAVVGCGKTILWSQTSCINISMPSKNVFHHIFITWQSWPAYFYFVDYMCRHICNGFMAQYEKSQRSNLWPFPINPSFWIHLTCGKLFHCFSCYCFTVSPVRIGPLSLLLGWSEDQQQTGPSPAFPSFEEILLELAEVSEYFWSTSSAGELETAHIGCQKPDWCDQLCDWPIFPKVSCYDQHLMIYNRVFRTRI